MVNIWKYKAQFMARGFVVDYEETTAPIHFIHGTSYKARMEVTLDRRGDNFLYGVDKNEVYMELSLGFETHDRETRV